ncbi:MAG: O-antigen ligase domain-containing protein [Acidobacteria bacterium]|nr:MAG: O-antigen ligase domain-containing protein [Acidobacteriota bacterium]REK01483.1 MAG: O-antigen ligase domain-containing protein [Acidobacteriota bacterium]REK14439.1 MAG: O-antigen ligase domain-containing protein [Acidobacteriota bacterium]REK45154.1 MAG: O-antigen ligase domain-containing protein [Acidobacteriota bacterium]
MAEVAKTAEMRSSRSVAVPKKRGLTTFRLILLVSIAHLPIGILVYLTGSLALLHPFAVLGAGLYLAFNKKFRLEQIALVMAYLVGAEVLWRMAEVPVFWEFGKYGTALIAIVALMRRGKLTIPSLPLVYFVLLVPGCLLVLTEQGLFSSRQVLSMQMSGPFLLLIACWFFSHCSMDTQRVRYLLAAMIFPILSVAFATLFFTVSVENIHFTGESNFATSGGFGPNQVSSILGLGAFLAAISILILKNDSRIRIYYWAIALFFTAQSVLTFSRSGIYNAIGGIIAVLLLHLRRPTDALKKLIPVFLIASVFLVFIFPELNRFTGGQLSDRFQDTNTSSRTQIAETDIQLFLQNPIFGVGIGESPTSREAIIGRDRMSHTEFTRLLSEHGVFGLGALLAIGAMTLLNFRKQGAIEGKALAAGTAVWSVLFMANTGMRLAAPGFLLAFSFITVVPSVKVIRSVLRREPRQSNGRTGKGARSRAASI